jgi:TetR/AcrR family transcriptional repressor of bet genes
MNEYSFILWHDSEMATTAKSAKRTATREKRRRQLIDAAVKCIARKGLGSTTIGDVAAEAGLSQGIVNLHFESKDNLFHETLRHLADEYKMRFESAMKKSRPLAADRLQAIMELDLSPSICERKKIAVWFAFWGEVKSRPTYRKICEKLDEHYDEVTKGLCDELIAEGNYKGVSGAGVATVLTSITNGLWQTCLISPKSFDRQQAMSAIDEYLRSIFPKHFPVNSIED